MAIRSEEKLNELMDWQVPHVITFSLTFCFGLLNCSQKSPSHAPKALSAVLGKFTKIIKAESARKE